MRLSGRQRAWTHTVIASEAKQSRRASGETLDCFAALAKTGTAQPYAANSRFAIISVLGVSSRPSKRAWRCRKKPMRS